MKPIITSKVLYKKYLTPDLVIVGFDISNIEWTYESGQFFHIILDKDNPDDEKTGFRPYSILNTPEDSASRHVVESFIRLLPDGLASKYVASLNIGDEVLIRGAFGRFMIDNNASSHVFFCVGTGITPIHSIIMQYVNSSSLDKEFVLFYGAKTANELLYHEKFLELSRTNKNFNYYPSITRESWDGLAGRLTEHVHLVNVFKGKTFYICGLKEFIISIRKELISRGVDSGSMILERYT